MAVITIGTLSPFDHEILTVNGVTSLTASKYTVTGAKGLRAMFTVETDQIRFWPDGGTPTNTEGHLLSPGDSMSLENLDQLKNFRAIKVTNNATLMVSYFKR
jgi:hypothetical protein